MSEKADATIQIGEVRQLVSVVVQAVSSDVKDPTDESGESYVKLGGETTITAPPDQIRQAVVDHFVSTLGESRAIDLSALDSALEG